MTLRSLLRQGFVTGLIVVTPLVITLFVISLIYSWIIGFITPLIRVIYPGTVDPLVQFIGLVVVIGIITGIGLGFRRGIGQHVVIEFDRVMGSVPIVRTLYTSAREASNAIVNHHERFQRVALVEWPGKGLYTIGFVTAQLSPRIAGSFEDPEARYDVFVPMAPNPLGGFLTIVPESRLVMTDLSVRQGLQMVLTSGMSGGN